MRHELVGALMLLTVITTTACDHHFHFDHRVDLQVELTATSGRVAFVGTVFSFDQSDIDFEGTTPFTAAFSRRRLPVEISVRRVTAFDIPLTLCVTDLDRGRQRCRGSTSTFVDVEI
jgi:hypothetical protein